MERAERLGTELVPQADAVDRLIEVVRGIARGERLDEAEGFVLEEERTRHYYVTAATLLGFLDASGQVSSDGIALSLQDDAGAITAFGVAFAKSACGARWLEWSRAATISDLDVGSAEQFLVECTTCSPSTCERRATTLRSWVRAIQRLPPRPRGSGRSRAPQRQLLLGTPAQSLAPDPKRKASKVRWPNPARFPHNEDGSRVATWLEEDLRLSQSVTIVTGYASLDQVVRFIAARDPSSQQSTRILFGSEPFPSRGRTWVTPGRVSDEVRDYWLRRGISPLLCGAVLRVRDAVANGQVQVRIGSDRRLVHAKIYVGDEAATLGSSNFTYRGTAGQTEANARFQGTERKRYLETRSLAESMWTLGKDYAAAFIALLDALLKKVTWHDALARACAAILEGDWARKYIPAEDLTRLEKPLWPHQLQGISQALWILENVGSVLVADAAGSGKTKMGAWLLRGTYDRHVRSGQMRTGHPAVVTPPQVADRWEDELRRVHLPWRVFSQGLLSNEKAEQHAALVETIRDAEVLAVDEAHNFLNASDRTRRMLCHYADHAVLFTATPINRDASDLIAMVELLGADNLSDEALEVVSGLAHLRRSGSAVGAVAAGIDRIRHEIETFMVRRTRTDLNAIAEERRTEYVMADGRSARYPHHRAEYYDVSATGADLRAAEEIQRLAGELTGIARLGRKLALPRALRAHGWHELRVVVPNVLPPKCASAAMEAGAGCHEWIGSMARA